MTSYFFFLFFLVVCAFMLSCAAVVNLRITAVKKSVGKAEVVAMAKCVARSYLLLNTV